MKFSLLALALAASTATARPCVTSLPSQVLADMGDGDEKIVTIANGELTLAQKEPLWNVTATLDDDCSAMIDFSKSDKPGYPPVPLKVAVYLESSIDTTILEYTDPSATLNPDSTYPLNLWTATTPQPASAPCPSFSEMKFQDMHDGDVKNVSVDAEGTLTMGQDGWTISTKVDSKSCQATVDFSKSTKPDQPPVPLLATVVQADDKVMLVFTDPSGELNTDSDYPLNIWEGLEGVKVSVSECTKEDMCVFNDSGDTECCSSGEMCIQGVGCRC